MGRLIGAVLAAAVALTVLWLWSKDAGPVEPSAGASTTKTREGEEPSEREAATAPPRTDSDVDASDVRRAHPADTPDWQLAGKATRGSKTPLPGVEVEIVLYEGYETSGEPFAKLTAETDAEGRFSVGTSDPKRTVTVVARAAVTDVRRRNDRRLVVFDHEPPRNLHVRVYPLDRTLRGQVVDSNGKGLDDAQVLLRRGEGFLDCDPEGRFEARISSLERVTLRASAPGYGMARLKVALPEKGDPDPVILELQPGVTVRGRVVDEAGEPIEGARVQTFFTSYFTHRPTDADGRFVLDYLSRARRSQSIFVRKEGFLEARVDIDTKDLKESYDITMKRGARVEGVVRDASGEPIPGAPLYIGFSPSDYSRLEAVANDDGIFVFPTVGPGKHDLVTVVTGHAPSRIDLVVRAGAREVTGVVVQLDPACFVEGIIVDAQGQPVGDVYLSARLPKKVDKNNRYIGGRAKTAANGTFRIGDLPTGTVDLECYGSDVLRHVETDLEVNRTGVRIVVARAAKLAGRVVAAATKAPIGKFRIKILQSQSGGYSASWLRGHDFVTEDGRWRTENEELKPGATFVVEAAAKGYGRQIKRMKATVAADPDAAVFELAKGQTVTGTVFLKSTGSPVEGARVVMFTADDPIRTHAARDLETRVRATTDAAGKFTLRDVPIGKISLAVECLDAPRAVDGPFEVAAGAPIDRQIFVAGSASVAGTIVDGAGRPIGGGKIVLTRRTATNGEHWSKSVRSDAAGAFLFDKDVGAGDYQLVHQDEGKGGPFTVSKAEFALTDGESKRIELKPFGPGAITGTVQSEDGAPLPDRVTVFFTRRQKSAFVYFNVRAVDGKFDVRGLPVGTIEVHASAWTSGVSLGSGTTKVETGPDRAKHVDLVLKKRR